MAVGIYFDGQAHVRPVVLSRVNVTGFNVNRLNPSNEIGFVGDARAGLKDTVLTIDGPSDARELLISGTSPDLMDVMFSPAQGVPGARRVKFVRVGDPTQATLSFNTSATPVITFTSLDYGAIFNQIQGKVEAGTIAGVKVTLDSTLIPERSATASGDNLGPAIEFGYVGAGDPATIAVTAATPDAATAITSAVTGGIPQDTFTLDLTSTQFNTVEKVVTYVNGLTNWEARVGKGEYTLKTMNTNKLDALSATTALGDEDTAQAGAAATITLAAGASGTDDAYNLMQIELTGGLGAGQIRTITDYTGSTKVADVAAWTTAPDSTTTYRISLLTEAKIGAIVHHFDGIALGQTIATAARIGTQVTAPDATSLSMFTGGTDDASLSTQDYIDAMDLLANERLQILFVDSVDTAVQAAALSHVVTQSNSTNRKERIYVTGVALAASVTAAKQAAQDLGSNRCIVAYPGIKRRNNSTSRLDTLSSLYTAAALTGIIAGSPPPEPPTNTVLRISGVESNLSTADVDDLLTNGVTPIGLSETGNNYVVIQGITTWTQDTNVLQRKIPGIRIQDFINDNIRGALQPYIGTILDGAKLRSILTTVVNTLTSMVRTSANPGGVLTGTLDVDTGAPLPPFRNVNAQIVNNELVAITWEGTPVGELDYITSVANLTPLRVVASV